MPIIDLTPTQASGGVCESTPIAIDLQGNLISLDVRTGAFHKEGKWSHSDLHALVTRDCVILRNLRSTHSNSDQQKRIILVAHGEQCSLNGGGKWGDYIEFPVPPASFYSVVSSANRNDILALVADLWPAIVCAYAPKSSVVQTWLDAAKSGGRPVPECVAALAGCRYLIVSRHPATIEFLHTECMFLADAPVIESAVAGDVEGKVVYGNLPLHLACKAYAVCAVEFYDQAPRGLEYTLDDMRRAGAHITKYRVSAI